MKTSIMLAGTKRLSPWKQMASKSKKSFLDLLGGSQALSKKINEMIMANQNTLLVALATYAD